MVCSFLEDVVNIHQCNLPFMPSSFCTLILICRIHSQWLRARLCLLCWIWPSFMPHASGCPFVVDANDFASIFVIHFDIRCSFIESIIWVEREIYNLNTLLLFLTFRENLKLVDNESMLWEYGLANYRVYELPNSQMGLSTELFIPL